MEPISIKNMIKSAGAKKVITKSKSNLGSSQTKKDNLALSVEEVQVASDDWFELMEDKNKIQVKVNAKMKVSL